MPPMVFQTWQFIVVALAGWLNRQQQDVVAYLAEENRVLREHLKGKRIRFTDDQRRRLAAKGKTLGRKVLADVCTLVTPETVLRWYRTLIARKCDGSAKRGSGRPPVAESIQELVVRRDCGALCAVCGNQAVSVSRQAPIHHCRPSIAPRTCPASVPERPGRVLGPYGVFPSRQTLRINGAASTKSQARNAKQTQNPKQQCPKQAYICSTKCPGRRRIRLGNWY